MTEQSTGAVQEKPQEKFKEKRKLALPKKGKKWRRPVIILAVALVLLALLSRCMSGGQQAAAGAYFPAPVQRRDLTTAVSGTGTVTPIDSYQLQALAAGEVLEAPFEVGDQVEKGDVLYRLDARDAQTAIQQAQLAVQSAQLSYDTLVRTRNDSCQIKANAAGVISALHARPGDTVAAGTPVADILDRDNMKLKVPFHSVDASGFFVGQAASVTVAGTAETLYGSISEISATDSVGLGGTLVRNVTIVVTNPGALSDSSVGSAAVGEVTSAASGTFTYGESKQVIALSGGELQSLSVKEGDRVSDGQILGQFKQDNLQDQVDAAAISLENAKLSLQTAQNNLENYTITAPISGTVIEKNVKAGDKVDGINSGTLAVIYDLSYLKLEMNISELDLSKLQEGQEVDITADAIPGEVFVGKVDRVSINGTTTNGFTTYPATILLEEYGELNPGMNVSAGIIVDRVENVLAIPAAAVQRGDTVLVPLEGCLSPDGTTVLDPSKVEERAVTLGGGDGEYVEITSGLSEGETVLVPAQLGMDTGAAGGGSVTVS